MPEPPTPVLPLAVRPRNETSNEQTSGPVVQDATRVPVLCSICSSSEHLKGNCPSMRFQGCGGSDHCKTEYSREAHVHTPPYDSVIEDGSYRTAMCRSCGSSHHVQDNCPVRHQPTSCFQCHQQGHMMVTCPLTRCYNCGAYGHSSQICYSRAHCFHCSDAGHRAADCPDKHKGRICYQCKEPGHQAANCPQGHLCKLCHLPGHVLARCPKVVCRYCYEKGHTAGACAKLQYGSAYHLNDNGQQDQNILGPLQVHEEEELKREPSPPSRDTVSSNSTSSPEPVASKEERMCTLSYTTQGKKRVLVVIDGSFFERCLKSYCDAPRTIEYYAHITEVLNRTLEYIGIIFDMNPIAYWFDIDLASFMEFSEKKFPSAYREAVLMEADIRERCLTSEMGGDRLLSSVVVRMVGGMRQRRGYTVDGPSLVWVEAGVDAAIATCVLESFQDHRLCQQVVLLCGDPDVYPAVYHCNMQRRTSDVHKNCPPVRLCGTSASIPKIYTQQQDLFDFLPQIFLDKPLHNENGVVYEFPTYKAFCTAGTNKTSCLQ